MAIFNRWKLQLGCNLKIKRYFLPAGRQAFIFVVQKIRRPRPKKKGETSQSFNPGDRVFFYLCPRRVTAGMPRAATAPRLLEAISLYLHQGPRGRRPGALPGCSPLLLLGSFRQPGSKYTHQLVLSKGFFSMCLHSPYRKICISAGIGGSRIGTAFESPPII